MADKKESIVNYQDPKLFVKSIEFNDGNTINFNSNDIVVFTGANNAGKSQILREISESFKWGHYSKKVSNQIELEFSGDIKQWIESNFKKDYEGKYKFHNGMKSSMHEILMYWKNKELDWNIYGYFVRFLNTIERFKLSDSPASIDLLEKKPHHPIQILYSDRSKEEEISSYFRKAFDSNLIVDVGAGERIPVFIGNSPNIPKNQDRIDLEYRKQLKQLPRLQEQGDGMRSFTGILLELFIAPHMVTLIDEPELFLHPPQSRVLAKMLANTKLNTQLFIATHSEDFLKGLLDTNNKNVKIIRINRDNNINNINVLNNDSIKQLWKDPILRYSNILSGLFHSKVVVCESDSDCKFYQAIADAIHDIENTTQDILFVHCGGKQRFKTIIKALKTLNVKTVIIADIDILNDQILFQSTIESFGLSWTDFKSHWKILDNFIKNKKPQLDMLEVKAKIEKIINEIPKSAQIFPATSIEEIKSVIKNSSAWSLLKDVGINFLSGEPLNSFNIIDKKCRDSGLFIVPVGELEGFYKNCSNHGPQWVNDVLDSVKDLSSSQDLDDARKFLKEIIDC